MESHLNDSQSTAVAHGAGPMLVLAGPGSGKTTVIIHRVKHLIIHHGISPREILVLTYTKACAKEMEARYYALNDIPQARVEFSTFHALCFRILRNACGYCLNQVIQEDEKWNVLKRLVTELAFEVNDYDEFVKNFASSYSYMKNELLCFESFVPKEFPPKEFIQLGKRYEAYKAEEKRLDFDDMVSACYNLLQEDRYQREKLQQRYQYILIDEFQDINQAQYALVRLLALPQNNLFIVGDDDQSIYQFRGARPEFLLSFPKEYKEAKKVILGINYRSTETLLKVGQRLIQQNKNRFSKEFSSCQGKGEAAIFFTCQDAQKEANTICEKIHALAQKGIAYEEMAVIYRTNTQARYLARALLNSGLAYSLKDGFPNIYEHWITKDICAYFTLTLAEADKRSFLRIVNKPKRYISRELLAEAGKRPDSYFVTLMQAPELKAWQRQPILELRMHLTQMRKRKPFEAIKYLRNVVGYDDYLQEYARYSKAGISGFLEIADEILEASKELEKAEDFLYLMDQLRIELSDTKKRAEQKPQNAVTLSTMHSAKGLEFTAVFLPSLVEGVLPHEKSTLSREIEEERRLFYVGITRAKRYLYLSEVLYRFEEETRRSRFLKELGLSERKEENRKT